VSTQFGRLVDGEAKACFEDGEPAGRVKLASKNNL
jgi:hypothetical protein